MTRSGGRQRPATNKSRRAHFRRRPHLLGGLRCNSQCPVTSRLTVGESARPNSQTSEQRIADFCFPGGWTRHESRSYNLDTSDRTNDQSNSAQRETPRFVGHKDDRSIAPASEVTGPKYDDTDQNGDAAEDVDDVNDLDGAESQEAVDNHHDLAAHDVFDIYDNVDNVDDDNDDVTACRVVAPDRRHEQHPWRCRPW